MLSEQFFTNNNMCYMRCKVLNMCWSRYTNQMHKLSAWILSQWNWLYFWLPIKLLLMLWCYYLRPMYVWIYYFYTRFATYMRPVHNFLSFVRWRSTSIMHLLRCRILFTRNNMQTMCWQLRFLFICRMQRMCWRLLFDIWANLQLGMFLTMFYLFKHRSNKMYRLYCRIYI
jgi:hypothetical protein